MEPYTGPDNGDPRDTGDGLFGSNGGEPSPPPSYPPDPPPAAVAVALPVGPAASQQEHQAGGGLRLARPDLLGLQGAPGTGGLPADAAEQAALEQEDLDLALAMSMSLNAAQEDEQRRKNSGGRSGGAAAAGIAGIEDEDAALQRAIELSKLEAEPKSPDLMPDLMGGSPPPRHPAAAESAASFAAQLDPFSAAPTPPLQQTDPFPASADPFPASGAFAAATPPAAGPGPYAGSSGFGGSPMPAQQLMPSACGGMGQAGHLPPMPAAMGGMAPASLPAGGVNPFMAQPAMPAARCMPLMQPTAAAPTQPFAAGASPAPAAQAADPFAALSTFPQGSGGVI